MPQLPNKELDIFQVVHYSKSNPNDLLTSAHDSQEANYTLT